MFDKLNCFVPFVVAHCMHTSLPSTIIILPFEAYLKVLPS